MVRPYRFIKEKSFAFVTKLRALKFVFKQWNKEVLGWEDSKHIVAFRGLSNSMMRRKEADLSPKERVAMVEAKEEFKN